MIIGFVVELVNLYWQTLPLCHIHHRYWNTYSDKFPCPHSLILAITKTLVLKKYKLKVYKKNKTKFDHVVLDFKIKQKEKELDERK